MTMKVKRGSLSVEIEVPWRKSLRKMGLAPCVDKCIAEFNCGKWPNKCLGKC